MAQTPHRMRRVNTLVREEISRIVATELNDPRLRALISVTEAQTSSDLRRAKVFVSVLGDADAKRDAMDALNAAGGYIHREMKRNLKLKYVPFLSFRMDDSIEKGAEMQRMIASNAPASIPDKDGGEGGADKGGIGTEAGGDA